MSPEPSNIQHLGQGVFYMSDKKQVLMVVREWIHKAENDLKAAEILLEAGEDCPAETVCFHCQQCLEKYLKAVLAYQGISAPKTHDIELLAGLVSGQNIEISTEDSRTFSAYAVETRYPGFDVCTLSDAQQARSTVKKLVEAILKVMPTDFIQQTKQS